PLDQNSEPRPLLIPAVQHLATVHLRGIRPMASIDHGVGIPATSGSSWSMNHLPETSTIVDLRHAAKRIKLGQTPGPTLRQALGSWCETGPSRVRLASALVYFW